MMRRAHMNKTFVSHDDRKGNPVFDKALLGFDATSEHEWGIDGLMEKFHIPRTKGKKPRDFRINDVPPGFHMGYRANHVYVTTLKRQDADFFLDRYTIGGEFETFWDDKDFMITVDQGNKYNREMINQLYSGICHVEAAIYLMSAWTGKSLVIEYIHG